MIEPLKWDGDRLDIARIDDTKRACYLKIQDSINQLRYSLINIIDHLNAERKKEMIEHSELLGALARGYCTKRNENKVLDPELIEDMAKEVEDLNAEKVERCPDGESEKDYYPDKRHYEIGTQKLKENEISDCVYVGTCPFQRKKGKPSAELNKDDIAKRLSNPKSIEDVLMQCGAYGAGDSKYIADAIRSWLRENKPSVVGEEEIHSAIMRLHMTEGFVNFEERKIDTRKLAHAIAERLHV